MAELYDILKAIQASPELLLGGSGGLSSVDEDGKITTPALDIGPNQRITASESGANATILIKTGTDGNASLFFLDSDSNLKGIVFYDDQADKVTIESSDTDIDFVIAASKSFNFIGAGPDTDKLIRLQNTGSNGGAVDFYITGRDPSGFITGNPGDLVFRANGANSRQYIHEGASASNDDWAEIATMPPGQTNIHDGSIHDSINYADGSIQDTASTPDGISFHPSTLADIQTKSVNPEDTDPLSIFVRPDGLKLYMGGNTNDTVFEYNMTTAWDVSTLVFSNNSDPVGNSPRGLFFKPDGTKYWSIRFTGLVEQFNLGTPWDISTASNNGNFSVGPTAINPASWWWRPDGFRFYVKDVSNNVIEFILTVPWDVNTDPTVGATFDAGFPNGLVAFRSDGRSMYLSNGSLEEYELSTPWDITTAKLVDTGVLPTSDFFSISFKPDGTKFFGLDRSTALVHEFNLGIRTSNIIADSFTTDGTDLAVAGRIDGAGSDGLLKLLAGSNSPIGGAVQIEGGGASTTGGKVQLLGGLGVVNGGNIELLASEGGNGVGGSVISTGGNGAVDDGSGAGGDVVSTGGQGGFDSGKGGDVNLTSGQSEGATAVSGSINLDIGDPFGGGPVGNIFLAKTRGRVKIGGASDPDVSALLDMVSTTKGQLIPRMTEAQRNAIPSPANGLSVHTLNINKPSYFDSNAWRNVGALSSFEFEIFEAADLDILDAGDVITVDGVGVLITLKEAITSTKRFNVINGGGLIIRFSGGPITTWTYSGTATFITANGGGLNIIQGSITGNSSATLFDVSNSPGIAFHNMTVLFFGSYGTIRDTAFVLMNSDGFFAGNGTLKLIDNVVVSITNVGLNTATPVSGAVILMSGRKTGFFDLSTWNVILQSGESFIRLDPYAPTLSATLTRIRVIGGELFDTTGGATGTFTVVAPAAIGPQGISIVSDAGGIASFNFTPGPEVFVGQEVTLSGYVTNTAYNGTFIISDAGVGVFEIAEIPFGTDEASGSFSGDSITLTDIATTLVNGDTLVLNTDGPTDYDGGAQVYNKLTDSFQVNRKFTSTHTGTWDTAGINQKDPRVLANNNPGFIDSKAIAFGDINAHAATNSITDGTYLELAPAGMVQRPSTERFKLIIDSGRWEYTGNEPFQGLLTAEIFATKPGATANYRFSLSINSAIPNFANAPYTPMEVKTTKIGVTVISPISLIKGDHFQIYVAGDGTGDDITVTDLLMSVQ